MDISSDKKITLYTSRWCAHAVSVARFLDRNEIPIEKINIDGDQEARQELIKINNGYASVPTLVFPDGSKLTEPSISQLRQKLEMEPSTGLVNRIRGILGQPAEPSEG